MSKLRAIPMVRWCVFAGMILGGLMVGGVARAQQESPAAASTPPPVPSMKPKVPAHWIVTYQHKETAPAGAAAAPGAAATPDTHRLVKEDYQLDGQTAAVNRYFSDGTVEKAYVVKGIAFIANPVTQRVRALMLTEGAGQELRFASTYPGFEWLKNEFFVDLPEQGGRKLAHYRQAITKGKGGTTYDPYEARNEREAWVDADSHLPFAFREGGLSGVYQFESANDLKITLPPDIEKAIRYYNGLR